MGFSQTVAQPEFPTTPVLIFQKIFLLPPGLNCEEMLQSNTGLHPGFFHDPFPQNVYISPYELQ